MLCFELVIQSKYVLGEEGAAPKEPHLMEATPPPRLVGIDRAAPEPPRLRGHAHSCSGRHSRKKAGGPEFRPFCPSPKPVI